MNFTLDLVISVISTFLTENENQKSDETIKKENKSVVSLTFCIFISVLLEMNHH